MNSKAGLWLTGVSANVMGMDAFVADMNGYVMGMDAFVADMNGYVTGMYAFVRIVDTLK